jgi:hypothetical protein
MKIEHIQFVSPVEDVNLDNDNIDVHVYLEDGHVYSFSLQHQTTSIRG